MPCALVETTAVGRPLLKRPLGPEEGAVKVARIPGTGLPELSLKTACKGALNAVATVALWLLPELGLMLAGGPNARNRSIGVAPSSPPAISSRPSPLKSP